MIRIDRAQPRDFLPVAELDRRAWGDNRNATYIPDGEHAWRLWTEHAFVFVARDTQGGVSAVVGAVLAFPCMELRLFCLHKVFVDPAFRGQGIGGRLLEATFEALDARETDCFLTVDPENVSAIRLYETWGFTERRFVEGFYREEEDRLVMTRRAKENKAGEGTRQKV